MKKSRRSITPKIPIPPFEYVFLLVLDVDLPHWEVSWFRKGKGNPILFLALECLPGETSGEWLTPPLEIEHGALVLTLSLN
ncbi:MAG TPA: hypothetical protein VMV05_00900 [bacterium]|nr:hypothetical protein [bacterium]